MHVYDMVPWQMRWLFVDFSSSMDDSINKTVQYATSLHISFRYAIVEKKKIYVIPTLFSYFCCSAIPTSHCIFAKRISTTLWIEDLFSQSMHVHTHVCGGSHWGMSCGMSLHTCALPRAVGTEVFRLLVQGLGFKLWHVRTNERVHRLRLRFLHGIVVLPVNKDAITLNKHRVSDLYFNYKGRFPRPCFCARANFLNGSWTSNVKTSV